MFFIIGKIKFFGVIGYFVGYFLFFVMYNVVFQVMVSDYVYVVFFIVLEDLIIVIVGLGVSGVQGLSVIIFYK